MRNILRRGYFDILIATQNHPDRHTGILCRRSIIGQRNAACLYRIVCGALGSSCAEDVIDITLDLVAGIITVVERTGSRLLVGNSRGKLFCIARPTSIHQDYGNDVVDLEAYDYLAGTNPPARASEKTVVDRLPPRIKVRSGACLEMPHILVLIDDEKREAIEPLTEKKDSFEKVYDFDLMEEGGHIRGYKLSDGEAQRVVAAMDALGQLVAKGKIENVPLPAFNIERPADVSHGDFSCNAALVSAKAFRSNPRAIATAISERAYLDGTMFDKIEVAGPGFINFFVSGKWFSETVEKVISLGADYGKVELGKGKKVLVEFVSANPTGPMHVGNARGGAMGDCLAEVLSWAGYETEREFYINDGGNQIEKQFRHQRSGFFIEFPKSAYFTVVDTQ